MDAKKVIKYVVFVVVVGNLALMAYVFLGTASPKPAPMPNPNGYDDFVKAAHLLEGNPADYQKMNREELSKQVATNAETLRLLETGIKRECRVSGDYSPSRFQNVTMPQLSKLRQCGWLFCAEGRLAELDGRTNDAMIFYLEGMRFGQACGQGGVFIEKLVSIACESAAGSPLENLRGSLDAKHCADIAATLEAIDLDEESDETVVQHEKNFANMNGGFKEQFIRLVMFKSIRTARKKSLGKLHAWTIHRRQIMLTFAARAYELDKGKPPSSAADLVPQYLKKIPQDPVTGTNLIWQP